MLKSVALCLSADAFSPTSCGFVGGQTLWKRRVIADLQNIDPNQPTIARPDEIVFRAHAVMVSEQARRFAQHPVMRDLVQDLIGPQVRLYWDQLVYKRPGTREDFPQHQDNGYNYVQPQHGI